MNFLEKIFSKNFNFFLKIFIFLKIFSIKILGRNFEKILKFFKKKIDRGAYFYLIFAFWSIWAPNAQPIAPKSQNKASKSRSFGLPQLRSMASLTFPRNDFSFIYLFIYPFWAYFNKFWTKLFFWILKAVGHFRSSNSRQFRFSIRINFMCILGTQK